MRRTGTLVHPIMARANCGYSRKFANRFFSETEKKAVAHSAFINYHTSAWPHNISTTSILAWLVKRKEALFFRQSGPNQKKIWNFMKTSTSYQFSILQKFVNNGRCRTRRTRIRLSKLLRQSPLSFLSTAAFLAVSVTRLML